MAALHLDQLIALVAFAGTYLGLALRGQGEGPGGRGAWWSG